MPQGVRLVYRRPISTSPPIRLIGIGLRLFKSCLIQRPLLPMFPSLFILVGCFLSYRQKNLCLLILLSTASHAYHDVSHMPLSSFFSHATAPRFDQNIIDLIMSHASVFSAFHSQSSMLVSKFVDSLSFNDSYVKLNRYVYQGQEVITATAFDHDSDFSRIHTPYSADAFQIYLDAANIRHLYPSLSFKIRHGFSLGNLPHFDGSYTPDNLRLADPHVEVINKYIQEELDLD